MQVEDRRAPLQAKVGAGITRAEFDRRVAAGTDRDAALELAATIELAVEALYQAADEDSATGGPDPVRGIYPVIATIAP